MSTTTRTRTKTNLFIGIDGSMRLVEIERRAGLEPYYQLIDTRIVERTPARMEGFAVDLWCDEEGLLHGNPVMNAMVYILTGRQIVGNVVVESRSLDRIVAKLRAKDAEITEDGDDDEPEAA